MSYFLCKMILPRPDFVKTMTDSEKIAACRSSSRTDVECQRRANATVCVSEVVFLNLRSGRSRHREQS